MMTCVLLELLQLYVCKEIQKCDKIIKGKWSKMSLNYVKETKIPSVYNFS